MASFIESVTPASVAEQLCYIPCKFCNIVLAVSVPCSCLLDMVTVRCGHCGNLWSVNMAAAAFNSLSSASATAAWQLQQYQQQQQQKPDLLPQAPNYNMGEYRIDQNMGSSWNKYNNKKSGLFQPNSLFSPISANVVEERVVNRPPEKRQRVPSAYNQFIKEEIQRIKANNPDISHREAFSTAAKNWAHFPHIHFGLMLEASNQVN